MLWVALLLNTPTSKDLPPTEALLGLAMWCLQFTPRVTIAEETAVLMEVEASARLFGGKRRLLERVRDEAQALGVSAWSWAPTSLGALALARSGVRNGFAAPLQVLLDALPLAVLSAAAAHAPTLARLGCRTLGQVRALPRGGLSRRFDKELLAALDRAYGLRPHDHAWVSAPEKFCARLELMSRVESAPALLFGARRLLLQLCGWLAGRRLGLLAFTLRWRHDAMRSKAAGEGGELILRLAEATREVEHLSRLLAEHLAKIELQAAVGELELEALDVQSYEEKNASFLPDAQHAGISLTQALERIAARLGPEHVLRPRPVADHRLEWMVNWQASTPGATPSSPSGTMRRPTPFFDLPQPTFILPQPLQLAMKDERPMYQGVLQLLCGPQRVEGGWWHRVASSGSAPADEDNTHEQLRPQTVARDYWVAWSEHAGVLWIFQTRLAHEEGAWFLHGVFA